MKKTSPLRLASRTQGIVLTIFAMLILSPDALLIRLVNVAPWTLLFWRSLLLGLVVSAYLVLAQRRNPFASMRALGWRGGLAMALLSGNTILFLHSITQTSVANTLIIISAVPLFSAWLSRIFLSEAIPRRTWIASVLVFAGLGVIFSGSFSRGTFSGDLLGVGSAVCMAGYFVLARSLRQQSLLPALAISGYAIAIVCLPLAIPLAVASTEIIYVAIAGLLVLPLAFGLLSVAPRHLPTAEVSLIMLLETILGPFWVWLLIGEIPVRETLFGGTLVLLTLLFFYGYCALRRR